jgi:hypothetical protein
MGRRRRPVRLTAIRRALLPLGQGKRKDIAVAVRLLDRCEVDLLSETTPLVAADAGDQGLDQRLCHFVVPAQPADLLAAVHLVAGESVLAPTPSGDSLRYVDMPTATASRQRG